MLAAEALTIIIVNHYYPPDTAATATSFRDMAQALRGAGHDVTVVCGRPSYNTATRKRWAPLRRSTDRQVKVEQIGSTTGTRHSFKARIAGYATYLFGTLVRLLCQPKVDAIVVGSDPPVAVIIALLASKGSPVIYSLQDLHPEAAILAGMVNANRVTDFWESVHQSAMRRCASIVCLGGQMVRRIEAVGVPKQRIHLIPTGAPAEAGGSPDQRIVQELRAGADFLILHAGNLSVTGAWECVMAAKMQLGQTYDWLCVGSGMYEVALKEAGFRVTPFRPPEEIPSVLSAGDLALVTQRPGSEGLVVPSKLYSLLACGQPILAVVPTESEVAVIVSKYECGLVADPNDPSDVVSKIRWAAENREATVRMGMHSLEAARDFDRGRLMDEFVRVVSAAAKR